MKKIIEFIKKYIIAISVFWILGALLKTSETIYFIQLEESFTFNDFLKSILSLIIVYSFYSILLLPIYAIFNVLNRALARSIISIVFSSLILLETGLTVYLFHTGSLIGAELIIRPISEVIATIATVVNLWVPIAGIIFVPIMFYLLLSFLNKKKWSNKALLTISILALIPASSIALLPKLYDGAKNSTIRNYIQNKSFYCFNSIVSHCLSGRTYGDIVFEKQRIKEFMQENPERKIINKYYPLEREYERHNILAPYFKPDTVKPNIVIVVLESLGREWNEPNHNEVSFTPFLDSLAKTGLYWKNCISTTKRSFGAVPSITGSLPFGVKGFQFGNMPEHHSLIKILKINNYKTNAFYAGTFYFDAINDYLLAQEIDYMSENYYIDYGKNKTEDNGISYWGYHDSIIYAKALQDQNFLNDTTPLFNLFVTTSGHQEAEKNNPYFQRAYKLAHEIILSAPKEKQESYLKQIDRSAAILYQDLCLKDFFERYKKRKSFENTIFVFTGDHSSGLMKKNDLSLFHVPLIIWSPLLLHHKTFPALVSHNDFVPTMEALLKENYNLQSSQYVHWLGNALDTSSQFVSNVKTVMFDYSGGYKDLIYNNYYYNHQLYEIQNENLDLKEIQNNSLKELMHNKLDLYKYIHKYVYLNDKLTNHPLFAKTNYQTIIDMFIKDTTILFESVPQWKDVIVYPKTNIEGTWEKIKISLTADIMFLALPENQQFYNFVIECKGQNMQNADTYHDRINKYIMVEDLEPERWYPLNIGKQFMVDDVSDIKVKVYFCMDSNKPENHSELKNIRILIEGIKINDDNDTSLSTNL
ncbi:MAG: sulfatase-like hydrolase/transferase [Bacteroidales bacterium]|nr:sulfatase-like hydrolase/transferase [Bacteroidales bacterium]